MADNTIDILLNARLNASDAVGGVNEIQKAMRGLTLPKDISADLEKSFSKLTPLLKDYQKQLNKGFSSQKDIKNFNLLKEKIDSVFGDIKSQIKEVNGQEIRLKANTQEIDAVKNKIVKAQADLNNALQNVFKKNQSAASIETAFGKLGNAIPKNWTKVTDMMSKASGSFKAGNYAEFNRQLQNTLNYIQKLSNTSQVDLAHRLGMDKAKTDITEAQKYFNNFFNSLKTNIKEANNIESLRTKLSELGVELEGLNIKSLEDGPKAFEEWVQSIMNVDGALDQLHGSTQDTAKGMVRMVDEVNELKSSTQYFFSLRNMINLLKRGIDEAVQSVKDLDKAMTETAVVTDYKVSDLWNMLPEYTKVANQLGATTQGAYETMTLYYQQGLEQQQAFELGAETMKMARIAGLDYAETTDMMTAALRGFNMELNEVSAKRVNDVYSELAAITASDTEELGTAMQRTASIAASAGASFEGTTAFLAQAIETTREPAENIGTAMKTIVARFQEMKKNPLEISEVDGEEVDYNKIDAALKTIGVDLKDTNGQFREFDQVMLDISAKWNTLSQSQQRYIATTAAGSRQQSRFIAMVSNYDRTMQLMEAANNSAGASDEQFAKTMDSLESKLNQLHNAWERFTMGIANNGMIKLAVDGLTGFLNVTNKIIDTLSLGSGVFKSFLSIFAAFTGLKMAGRAANSLIGGLGGLVDPQSTVKEGLKNGLFGQGRNNAQAKAITTPIVGSLSKISGQIAAIAKRQGIKDAGQKGSAAGVKETSKEDYANTKRLFSQLSGKEGFKMEDTSKLFGNLDAKHQFSMFNNSPGTKLAMKQASLNWFNSKGLSKELTSEGKQLINSIYKGMAQGQIPVDKGIELIGRPDLWGEYFATDTAKAISKNFNLSDDDRRNVVDKTWSRLGMKLAAPETREAWLKENQDKYDKVHSQVIQDLFGHTQSQGKVSDLGRLANDIGSIGDKFTQAGYGITTFGNALSQLGGPIGAVGTGIAAFGSAISSMGMMVSGATSLITVFSEGIEIAGTSIAISGGAIAAVAAPLAAAAAAFLLVRAHLKKVKEAGEEVTNTFNETNKTAEDNIAKLKSYQSEFATLSKGVDSNGNNVSLDDSQYQRYLEIVDEIAAINPEIVEGYNAQGHAIINNNTALAETLKTQQQIKQEAYDTYTKEESLQKLINARNINNDFKAINVKGESPSVYDGSGHGSEGRQKPVGLGRDVFNIVDQLRLNKDFDESSLQKYGIDSLDSLINGEEQAVKNFIKHRQQIQADLVNSGLELNESIIKGFDKLGEDSAAFDEAIKPVYDNLLANVSNSSIFKSIAPEFRSALQTGLKDLASQDLNANEMAKAANNMAARFANLTTGSGKYKDALDIVEQAQQNFASSLDETQYQADVQPAIDDLIRLKEEALDEGSAYGDALAEYLENQIERISHFTEEGTISLSEALNTMQDDIAAAEGALSSFQESTKSDYSTAASGMKGIFDEIFKETEGKKLHTEGFGDQTFWKGAKELLSQDIIDTGNIDNVISKLNKIKPALTEGQEGWENFLDIVENTKGMDKWFKFFDDGTYKIDIPEEEFSQVAEQLGVSDNFLTSMLNKGRQFANISFSNVESVRQALATSDATIKGKNTTNGNKNLYIKEESLRAELFNQGYVTKDEQDRQLATYLKKGIKTIPAADSKELTADKLKEFASDWGIQNLSDLISTLNETGEFTKDEIKAYADKLGLLESEDRYDSLYDSIIEAANNPELARQTNLLETISAQVAALRDNRTGTQAKSDYDKFHRDLYGGDGHDTAAQKFGDGLNKEGKQLTAGEYEQTKKDLEESSKLAREQAEIARERAKTETGLEKEKWENLAKYYDQDADYIDTLLDRGAKAFEKAQKDIDKQLEANESKAKGKQKEKDKQAKNEKIGKQKADDFYQNRGFGNTDINNRQVLRWGANPSGSNLAAAKTWGFTKEDLQNSVSTYMSSGLTYGQGDNRVELTVTPMLQTENGTPKVLSSDTVSQYFDKIVSQATNSDGQIDIDKLFELDKEGLEVQGQEINNLLMGAFTGEGAREAATALAELEHQLEEDKVKAQELNKAANQIGKQEKRGQQQTPKKTETPSPQKVQESKDEGRKQNREIVTTIKYQAEEDPEVEDLNAKYGYDRTTKRIIEYLTKGEKDLQLAEDKISNIDLAVQDPKQIMIEANTNGISVAQAALNTLPKTREVKITASLKDFSSKVSSASDRLRSLAAQARDVKIGGTSAAGHNNTISVSHVPTFASAARGKGTVGPKNKGGLTLTGEEGFEIAWLPSAGKSMILGAAGPQMINLPSDAVVYTHEQSKDILKKRQTIPAGSHAGEVTGTGTRSRTRLVPVSSSASKNVASTTKKSQDSIQKAAKEVVKITQKAGTVLVWWENAGRRMDKAQRDAENVQRTLDKLLTQFGTTAEQYQRVGESYESYLKQQISIASEKETKAQEELIYTDLGGTPVAKKTAADAKKQKVAKAKLDKAQKAYKKSKTDKNKKKLEKAKDVYNKTRGAQIDTQNNNYLEAIGARQEISYEVTKRTRDKKGKWKTTKQTKQEKVNLASFIKNENGVYTIDQAAIDKIAKTNKSRAEAIKQAADKQLTDLLNKQKEAEDERIKAEEAIAEFYNSTYETFYAWEKTITTAYLLGKQLEQLSNIRTIFESVEDLEFAKIEAGFGNITNSLPKVSQALEQSRESMLNEVKINRKLVDATFEDYQSALSMESALEAVQQTNSSDAAKDADARRYALQFLEKIGQAENFDYSQAVEELNSTRWNRDDYDKIKDGLDQIADKQAAYYDALAKTYQSMTEVYKTIEEYQSYMSDFEKDLISGIEEQANREIDKLSKLNTSLTDAAKNLIDEVRRKLDERRKQEDNAKTEQDITNKQQRLAALRADTSGGHQVEIAQLEKELAEAQQNYGRTLEDQLLDRMSQQQDEAAKQREQQIQLLEAQRDFAAATGLNIEQINEWLKDPRRNEEQIRAAWLANNNYDKAGALERTQLEEQFNSAWMRFLAYGEALPALADIKEEDLVGTEQESKVLTPVENIQQGVEEIITLLAEGIDKATIQAGNFSIEGLKTDKNGNARSVAQIKGIMEANGQTVTARNFLDNGFSLSEISKNYSADELRNEKFGFSDIKGYYGLSQLKSYGAAEFAKNNISYADARKVFTATQLQGVSQYAASATKEITEASNKTAYTNAIAAAKAAKTVTKATFKDAVAKGAKAGVNKSAYQVAYDLVTSDGNVSGGISWNKVFKAAKAAGYKGTTVKKWNPKASKDSGFRKAFEKVYGSWSKFATGGLATYTGPAWLDGTPSKPELVLNAKDTQNFIALKDVLSHVMDGVSNTSNTYGDTLYEININVDKIEKDYDVDRVVDKVKKEIIKGAGYRNVTQVRNLR